jgi:hypothetical protein
MEIDKADLELVKSFMRKAYDDLKSEEKYGLSLEEEK